MAMRVLHQIRCDHHDIKLLARTIYAARGISVLRKKPSYWVKNPSPIEAPSAANAGKQDAQLSDAAMRLTAPVLSIKRKKFILNTPEDN